MDDAKHAAGRPALPEIAFLAPRRRIWWPALAVGLASSTLLGLLTVPVVFSYPDDLGALLKRRLVEV